MKAILRLLWGDARAYPLWFILGVILALVTALSGIGVLAWSGAYVAAATLTGGATASMMGLGAARWLMRGSAVFRVLGRYVERLITHEMTFRILAAHRLRVFRGLARQPFSLAGRMRRGEAFARMTADINALDGLYLRLALPVIVLLVLGCGVVLAAAFVSPLLAVIFAGIFFGLGVGVPAILCLRAANAGRLRAFALQALRLRSIDFGMGQLELIAFARLEAKRAHLDKAEAVFSENDARLFRLDAQARALVGLGLDVALVVMLLAVAWALSEGAIFLPGAFIVLLATVALAEVIAPLGRLVPEWGKIIHAARRTAPLISAAASPPAELETRAATTPLALALEGVSVRHPGARVSALDNVSLDIAAGERLALVGASGCGKSTLLQTVAGLHPLFGGCLRLEGREVVTDGVHLPVVCTFLTQTPVLFHGSLRENVRLGALEAGDAALVAALESVGLQGFFSRDGSGLDTMLGEGGRGLSGGEARRLALARALLRPTGLWLLDEVSENLDTATAGTILATLEKAMAGKTVLLATHKRPEAALCDRLVQMASGRIVADVRQGDPAFARILGGLREN